MKGLQVHLSIDEKDSDEDQLGDLAYFLQMELQELDCVNAVRLDRPAEGACGSLIIDLNTSADPTAFITTLTAWIQRQPFRSYMLRVGGYEVSSVGMDARQRQALVKWFQYQVGREEKAR